MPYVRQATMDDLETLQAFDEWDVVNEKRIDAGECFVAGLEEPPRAYGILDRSFMSRAFIAIVFVHPEHRRTGLGDALVADFESRTTASRLWVSTNIENLAMQGLLHRRGYMLSGVVNNLGAVPELFYFKPLPEDADSSSSRAG